MSRTRLRPNATLSNSGTLTGGATADAVLSDETDSTYVTLDTTGDNDAFFVEFDDFTLPAGDAYRDATLWLRDQKTGSNPTAAFLEGTFYLPGSDEPNQNFSALLTWTSTTGHAVETAPADVTAEMLDDAGLVLTCIDFYSNARVAEAYIEVVHVEQPVVNSVTVGGGAAPITEDSTPPVEWESTFDPDGGPQIARIVKIFTDAVHDAVGFDPDTSPALQSFGAFDALSSWTPDEVLPDGVYHAYVRVVQAVAGAAHSSEWLGEEFEIDTPLPGAPTLLVTPDPSSARVQLDIGETSGGIDTDYFEVEVSTDGEVSWYPIRAPLGGGRVDNDDGSVSIYDYEVGNGTEATYRARAVHDFDGTESRSEWTLGIGGWTDEGQAWLKHPTNPGLSMPVAIYSFAGRSRAARAGWHDVPGRADPVGVLDVRSTSTGEIAFMVEETDAGSFEELTEAPSPLLLQFPTNAKAEDRWLVLGDLSATRYVDKAWIEEGIWTFGWTEVERPSVDVSVLPDDEPPAEIPPSVDIDSFHTVAAGTGTLTVACPPTNDGQIVGVVAGIIMDDNLAGTDEIDEVTVEGDAGGPLNLTEVDSATTPTPQGRGTLYMLGSGIPDGDLEVVVTVTGATQKRVGVWLLYGNADVVADVSSPISVANTTLGSVDLVTTVDDDVVLAVAYESDNDVANISPGPNMTSDLEHDFGVNTGAWEHRTSKPSAGTVAVGFACVNATNDYGGAALAIRPGVATPPGGGAGVLKQDLAEADDPTAVSGINRGWRKVDSAFSPYGDLNWTAGDLQVVRLTTDPDPHIPVGTGGSPSTHYRRTILSECYLAGTLSGSPTSLAVTAISKFPIPSAATVSIEGERAFRYTGRSGTFPNYTLTGITWIDATPTAYAAGSAVRIQSHYDSGVPNDSYRTQIQRWSANPALTFYVFQPGTRRQILMSIRFDEDSLPWAPVPSRNVGARSQVWQMKPAPSSGGGPLFSMVQFGDEDELQLRFNVSGDEGNLDTIPYDPSVGWLRFMADITFDSDPSVGRFQLFGDLDGDRLAVEDLVPLTEQYAMQTAHAPGDDGGEVSGLGIGPYCPMVVPGHFRDYANIQVLDPTA
jgi:hypothetical protein